MEKPPGATWVTLAMVVLTILTISGAAFAPER
jgi:hypothetical protein